MRVNVVHSRTGTQASDRRAFTIIELLISVAVVSVLIALTVPAIQSARASARKVQCLSNLKQIGLAAHSYHDAHRSLPWTTPLTIGTMTAFLPYLEHAADYDQIRTAMERNDVYSATYIPGLIGVYLCPDDVAGREFRGTMASYSLNAGLSERFARLTGFVVSHDRPLSWSDVTDGLSNTCLISEKLTGRHLAPGEQAVFPFQRWELDAPCGRDDVERYAATLLQFSRTSPANGLGRTSCAIVNSTCGYNHVMTPNGPSSRNLSPDCSLVADTTFSLHAGGVQTLLADGSARFYSSAITQQLWWQLGSRADGDTGSE
jgi:prepilin-type N-terminal cleavage/methylation domain-containing protein